MFKFGQPAVLKKDPKQLANDVVQSIPEKPLFGFWTASSLVIGNMIGAGIFYLPASLASFGTISILGWLVTTIGALCLAYVFAKLSLVFPKSGGPYTHSHTAFGDLVGFMMGWGYWTMTWTSNAAISLAFVSYLTLFVPAISQNNRHTFYASMGVLWFSTLTNCIGVRVGGIIQVITSAMKVAPLCILAVVGIFYIDPANYLPLNVSSLSNFDAINAAAALTLWAFIGLEAATVPAGAVKEPGRTVSRATLFGTGLAAAIYSLVTIVIFGIVPTAQLVGSHAPFAEVAQIIFGSWVTPVIGISILIAVYGALNGWVLLQGQIPCAMANEGLFPRCFASASRNDTPVLSILISSLLASLLLFWNYEESLIEQFKLVILVGVAMTLIAYLASAFSVLVLFDRKYDDIHPYQYLSLKLKLAVAGGALYSIWAICGVGNLVLMLCGGGYLVGIPVFLWARWG